ncbi:Fatty acid oxidation complex subunit alpha [Diplonema papillatum]|nr:Fatty acid oxidation complex subunit alpha [Diplonema papillatum]|eukprot:gene19257-29662_t
MLRRTVMNMLKSVNVNNMRVLSMDDTPANVLNRSTLEGLTSAIVDAEKDEGVRGIVLTSGTKVFSAGLDIMEFVEPTEESLREYWALVQKCFLTLYRTPLATVAAVNGTAPGGGCMLAMACDYRVFADSPSASIGLLETKLGIVAPFWMAENFRDHLRSPGRAEKYLQRGDMLPAALALEEGLADEVCQPDDLLRKSLQALNKYLSVPDYARYQTKLWSRKPLADRLEADLHGDATTLCNLILDPRVQAGLKVYRATLMKKD